MEDFGFGVGTEERDTRLAEIAQTLEGWRCSKVATAMYDTLALIANPLNTALYMLLEYIHTPLHTARRKQFTRCEVVLHILDQLFAELLVGLVKSSERRLTNASVRAHEEGNVICVSKLDELAVLASGCPYMIIRTSWMFSRYGKNFVKTILNKTASQPSIKVVCDQIGTPTYAGDLAEFILGLIEEGNLDRSGIYNFTNEGVCSWYDLAWEVCDISGNLCEVLPCRTDDYPVKVVRPAFSVLDKSKVKSVFGVGIPYWKDSLRFCLSQM